MGGHHPLRVRCAAAVVALLAVVTVVSPPAASASDVAVKGTWQSLINCLPTSYNPFTKQLTCIGSTVWRGSWTGTTQYSTLATYDLLTGDSQGTIHEVFRGRAGDGTSGTLRFIEQYTLVGATSKIHIVATIQSGTAGFAGSTGTVVFDGTNNALAGSGTYAGEWQRPGGASNPTTNAQHTRKHHRRHHRHRHHHHRRRTP